MPAAAGAKVTCPGHLKSGAKVRKRRREDEIWHFWKTRGRGGYMRTGLRGKTQ